MSADFPQLDHNEQVAANRYRTKFKSILNNCEKTFNERSEQYGPVPQYFRGRNDYEHSIWVKVIRAFKTSVHKVRRDCLIDLINYAIFWLIYEDEIAEAAERSSPRSE